MESSVASKTTVGLHSVSFIFTISVLTGILVWFWAGASFVPSLDYPAHLALTRVMHDLGDPSSPLDRYFEFGTFPAPNSLFYVVTWLGSFVMSIEAAGRVFVALSLVGVVVGFTMFAVACGRSRWLGLAGVPLAIQWVFTEGFLDYFAGIGLLMMALAWLTTYLDRPTKPHLVALLIVGVLVFLAHVQAILLYGIGTVVVATYHLGAAPLTRRRFTAVVARVGLTWAPVLVLVAAWFIARNETLVDALDSSPPVWPTLGEKAHALLSQGLLIFEGGNMGGILFAVIFGVLAVHLLASVRRRAARVAGERAESNDSMQSMWLLLAYMAFYFIAPHSIGYYWNMHSRTILLLVLVSVVAMTPPASHFKGKLEVLSGLPWLAVAVVVFTLWHPSLRAWDAYTEGLSNALAALPKHGRTLYVPEDRANTGFSSGIWRHLGQYQTAHNGGTTTFSFGFHPGRIVREKKPEIIAEFADMAALSNLDRFGCLDGVLHKGQTRLEERFPSQFRLVFRHATWSTYTVVGRACPHDRE